MALFKAEFKKAQLAAIADLRTDSFYVLYRQSDLISRMHIQAESMAVDLAGQAGFNTWLIKDGMKFTLKDI